MPTPRSSLSMFSSEIAPTAWQQIAKLPQETSLSILTRLLTLANMASLGRHTFAASMGGTEAPTSLSFEVGDLAARYEADLQARVIRLLEVRSLPSPA
jgi:hypothetical protein